jgi:hypothetical protein
MDDLKRRTKELTARHRETIARVAKRIEELKNLELKSLRGAGRVDGIELAPEKAECLIDRYIIETRDVEFMAVDLARYVKGKGYRGGTFHNTIYHALEAKVNRGELVRVDGKFRITG